MFASLTCSLFRPSTFLPRNIQKKIPLGLCKNNSLVLHLFLLRAISRLVRTGRAIGDQGGVILPQHSSSIVKYLLILDKMYLGYESSTRFSCSHHCVGPSTVPAFTNEKFANSTLYEKYPAVLPHD